MDADQPPSQAAEGETAPCVDEHGVLEVVVAADDAGSRIDRFLGRFLAPHYSRSFLSALIDEGAIRLCTRGAGDEKQVRPAYRIEAGDTIRGRLGDPVSRLPGPEPVDFGVIHSDEQIVIVDKPAGVIIHPGSGAKSGTLVNGLLQRFPEIAVVGKADRPGIVHRLDRETTGVMVVARTNDAARSLVNQFKRKTVQKEYTAIVWGEMPFDSDWIDLPLDIDPKRPTRRRVVQQGGQSASTFYKVQRRLGVVTLVSAFPRTGRTHQIRVHLDHVGFAVIGDSAYGHKARQGYKRWCEAREQAGLPVPGLARHALHAHKLSFEHPGTGERVEYEAPLPADMAEVIDIVTNSPA